MFVANHTILKRKFWLKMMSQGAENEKMAYNYLIKEGKRSLIFSSSVEEVGSS